MRESPFAPPIGSRWREKGRNVFTVTSEPMWSSVLKVYFVHGMTQKLPPIANPTRIYKSWASVRHCDNFNEKDQILEENLVQP